MNNSTIVHTTLRYGPNPRQTLGIYRSEESTQNNRPGKWFVFIHGGAWRDPSNTYKDGEYLLESILNKQQSLESLESLSGTASIDYRLSPEIQHPGHIDDVIKALEYLCREFAVQELVLIGHSTGAFLALQVITRWPLSSSSLIPIPLVICAEGIYNLPYLIQEHASYVSFVEEAFGSDHIQWEKVSPLGKQFNWINNNKTTTINNTSASEITVVYSGTIVIVHSPEDELLGIEYQPAFAVKKLHQDDIRVFQENVLGKHDEVYISEGLVDIVIKYYK